MDALATIAKGAYAAADYAIISNPVSQTLFSSLKGVTKTTIDAIVKNESSGSTSFELPTQLKHLNVSKILFVGSPYVKLAAVSGAAAVCIGAYGSHVLMKYADGEERKEVYKVANLYHFIHSLALLGVTQSNHPAFGGACFTLGMILFCGNCYYIAFTGDHRLRRYTPVGGTLLIAGWLCLLL